jgi:hypothetical protein
MCVSPESPHLTAHNGGVLTALATINKTSDIEMTAFALHCSSCLQLFVRICWVGIGPNNPNSYPILDRSGEAVNRYQ